MERGPTRARQRAVRAGASDNWEDKGLLQADRSTRGHRRYRPDQVTRPYSVGAALAVAAQSDASLAGAVRAAAEAGFLDGLAAGCLVAAGVALAGAVLAWKTLPARPAAEQSAVGTAMAPATCLTRRACCWLARLA